MAIKKCKECQHPVSTKAETCPGCGAGLKPKISCLGLLLAGVFVFFLIGFIGSIGGGSGHHSSGISTTSSAPIPSVPSVPTREQASSPSPASTNWQYSHSDYEMGKGRVHRAAIESTNTVNFGFPYRGHQRGMLILRTHPKYEKDVIFGIERGQLLVRNYEDSIALVRFDDSDPISFKIVGAEDHSTTTAFLRDYQGFVSKMLKSKKVRISIPVYQEGSPVFEFDVSEFSSDAYLENNQKGNK